MALGFLMKDSLCILRLSGERDALGSELARFTRADRVQCAWGRFSDRRENSPFGEDNRGLHLAIVPPLEEQPAWVERAGRVYRVRETKRFSGFGADHWELLLEEYRGRFEIT